MMPDRFPDGLEGEVLDRAVEAAQKAHDDAAEVNLEQLIREGTIGGGPYPMMEAIKAAAPVIAAPAFDAGYRAGIEKAREVVSRLERDTGDIAVVVVGEAPASLVDGDGKEGDDGE